MATKQDAINAINNAITDNGNNAITASVLRPVLIYMVEQVNDIIGVPAELSTTTEILVDAINEVSQNATGSQILSGADDPNNTPPANASLGDFYSRTSNGTPISYWVLDGTGWIELVDKKSAQNNNAIRKVAVSSSFNDEDYTIRYQGSNAADVITIPAANASSERVINIINSHVADINTSLPYIDYTGASVTTIPATNKLTLQSDGTDWIKI